MNHITQAIMGYVCFLLIAWLISEKRSDVPWRMVVLGVMMQLMLAVLILKTPGTESVFSSLNSLMLSIEKATRDGTAFVFGYIGGGEKPYLESDASKSFILALEALPIVLITSVLSALLFHWRILPAIVKMMSWLLRKSLGIGGAVGISTAANVFMGMVESPLLIKPYLSRVSRGELFMIMSSGMAGVAGSVMAFYAGIIGPVIPGALGHIIAASFISAPASLVFAALMVPSKTATDENDFDFRSPDRSSIEAITRGTAEGLQLLMNIIAMLIVLVALVSLTNQMLSIFSHDNQAWSLQRILGYLMAPLAWLCGVSWEEAPIAGALLGTKTILNEIVAYLDLARLAPGTLSERSNIIMTYALCGFANLGSLGIMIGGLTSMAPERKHEILELSPKTLISGTLATLSCGCIVGILY